MSGPLQSNSLSLCPGTRLGVYEITAQIGAGGMGEVYRATDTALKRQVAIKVLPEWDGNVALVMELAEGPTLADRIAQGPVPAGLVVGLNFAEVLNAKLSSK